MKNMKFGKWFLKSGLRQYAIPYLLGIVIGIALLFSISDIMASPFLIKYIAAPFILPAFLVGITFDMIKTFKAETK